MKFVFVCLRGMVLMMRDRFPTGIRRQGPSSLNGGSGSSHLEAAFVSLEQLGPGYVAALRTGLRCERLFAPDWISNRRALALADIAFESPEIALAAFRGSVWSESYSERVDAAVAIPSLAVRMPEAAAQLLEILLDDPVPKVTQAAKISRVVMTRIFADLEMTSNLGRSYYGAVKANL
jgi:hypothetical protein